VDLVRIASGKVGYVVDNDLFAEVEQVSYKGLPECIPHIKVWLEDGRTIYRAKVKDKSVSELAKTLDGLDVPLNAENVNLVINVDI